MNYPRNKQKEKNKETFKYVPTHIPWFPSLKSKRQAKSPNDVGFFTELYNNPLYVKRLCLWKNLERSVAPILAGRYHDINVSQLIQTSADTGVSSWFAIWSKVLGMSIVQSVKAIHNQLKSPVEKDPKREGVDMFNKCSMIVNLDISYVEHSRRLVIIPQDNSELCCKASEFILNPCILMQLPWNSVLFNQWLLLALSEVLLFERDSLELRHWPIPNELFNIAQNTLQLIKELKERIILGLVIFDYTIFNSKLLFNLSKIILDNVVLPSLPYLRFLISGKAHQIIKSLKKTSWAQNKEYQHEKGVKLMPYIAFRETQDLATFFNTRSYYSYNIWTKGDNLYDNSKDVNILGLTASLKNKCEKNAQFPRNTNLENISKLLSTDEEKFKEGMERSQRRSPAMPMQDRVLLTMKSIKETLVDTERLPERMLTAVYDFLQTTDPHKKEIGKCLIEQAQLYNEAYKKLLGSEIMNSIVSRLIILQLQILEREQVVRMANICGYIHDISPRIPNIAMARELSLATMSSMITDVMNQKNDTSRESLWSQLPSEWREPVNLIESLPDITTLDATAVATLFEQRIGRLVLNLAKHSCEVEAVAGNEFPQWNIIQYILPNFVATFLTEANKTTSKNETTIQYQRYFVNFLHNFISHFETMFHIWQKQAKSGIRVFIDDPPRSIVNIYIMELTFLILQMYRKIMKILHVFTWKKSGLSSLVEFIFETLSFWPQFVMNSDLKPSDALMMSTLKWQENFYEYMKAIYKTCVKISNPPIPGSHVSSCTEFNSLYFADAVIQEIETLYYISASLHWGSLESDSAVDDVHLQIAKIVLGAKKMRYKEAKKFAEKNRKVLANYYEKAKKHRYTFPEFELKYLDKFPSKPRALRRCLEYYIRSDFIALDQELSILITGDAALSKQNSSKKCRKCSRHRTLQDGYITCETCIEQKYPDINYFCSKRCEETWWQEEHMAEHLEFELGIGEFSNITVTQ